MNHLYRSIAPSLIVIRGYFLFVLEKICACSIGKSAKYRRLTARLHPPPSPLLDSTPSPPADDCSSDDNVVPMKVAVLGDDRIGKTSFVMKYLGDEQQTSQLQMKELNVMGKTLQVQNAKISLSIWDVKGKCKACDEVAIACKDSIAIIFMFDLTSRATLNSVAEWFCEARKRNEANAMLVLIGTKFDEFSKLPENVQSLIVAQARAYAKTMKATLFFSSAEANINVSKVFKFLIAKIFNLPWTVERNLNVGEPIIDF